MNWMKQKNRKRSYVLVFLLTVLIFLGTLPCTESAQLNDCQSFSVRELKLSSDEEFLSVALLIANTKYAEFELNRYKRNFFYKEPLIPVYGGDLDSLIKSNLSLKTITNKQFLGNLFLILLFDYYNSIIFGSWQGSSKDNEFEGFNSPSFLFHQPFVGAYEEALFRGIMQNSFTNQYRSYEKGNLYSSAIFGSIHFLNYFVLKDRGYTLNDGLFQSLNAFIVSYFLLGPLYIRNCGDLRINSAVHAWNNILIVMY
ncbi:MAG TPA: CPBP family intramembrane metalloprotease, partial [Firmicutes bacterium]|nr:CPBP family intramembrane metalloprotease [Bacillota bacterium]